MVEGKNEDISTIELSGGARLHYIFQSIFVKSLEVWINWPLFSYCIVAFFGCVIESVKSIFAGS